MILNGFVGPTYVSTSPNVSIETLFNWYPQRVEVGSEKAQIVYYPTPGIEPFCVLDDFPVRGLFSQDGLTCAVAGQSFYTIDTVTGIPTKIGTLRAKDANPATMNSSGTAGHQIYITSGGFGDIYDTIAGTLTPITAAGYPDATPMGTYLDTYFLTIKGDSAQFNISGLLDGQSWSSLDFAVRVQASDNLVGIIQNNKVIWLIGSLTSEPWYDSGAATFPFQSVPQILIPMGSCAPFSITRISAGGDGAVGWMHQSERGRGEFVVAQSYSPQRVSTYAVEATWSQDAQLSNTSAYCYTDQGHEFCVLTVGNSTWVYDFTEQLWHRRGWWNAITGQQDRQRGWVHCNANGIHLLGDWETGVVYRQDNAITTDAGSTIVRQRRAPHLSNEQKFNFYSAFQLDMETGLGTSSGQGSAPIALLQWSDDGGHTWSAGVQMNAGVRGDYLTRCMAHGNLGRSRDRVFQVTVSDPIPWRLLQAYVQVTPGTN